MKLYDRFYKRFGIHVHGEARSYFSNIPARDIYNWLKEIESENSLKVSAFFALGISLGMAIGALALFISERVK